MPRMQKSDAELPELITVHPVAGRFLTGMPHVSTMVTADEAEALIATGAFAAEPVHMPSCDERCDAANGWHYLDNTEPASHDAGDAGNGPPGDQPPPSTETATQPDGPGTDAGPSDSQE